MKYLGLVWAGLFRKKLRTTLTLFSLVSAFLLLGLLQAVNSLFAGGADFLGANRLITQARTSFTQPLPMRMMPQIEAVPGVSRVSHSQFFGGQYQDPRNFFPQFAVNPQRLRDTYPEWVMPEDNWRQFVSTRNGAIAGRNLADKFGWKVGDTIPLQATIFPQKDGSNAWPLTLRGTFRLADSKRKGEENQLIFHWKYFDEANQYVNGQVGWYMVKLDNVNHATRVAKAIDAISENYAGSNILGFLNLFTGGGLSRIAIFALGIMPLSATRLGRASIST